MIEVKKNIKYEVLTPRGFKPFAGIRKTTKSEAVELCFEQNDSLICSLDHIFIKNGQEVKARTLKVGDTLSNNIPIVSIKLQKYFDYLYDLVEVQDGNTYIADGSESHNCDFSTSGETFLEPDTLNYYEQNTICEPIERRGIGKNYWLWAQPDPTKTYMVIADVARGDGKDYSTYHVMDVEEVKQVAEYRDQLPTKDFARMLEAVAVEWNDALLVVENSSIGWDVVTTLEERGYRNLYYSPKSEVVGTQMDLYVSKFDRGDGMVPGFSMNQKTRPLVLEKMRSFVEDKSAVLQSQRLLDECRVFIWKNGKAQAMHGYNDDLVMPWAVALFLRDTALRFKQAAYDLTYASLNNFTKSTQGFQIYTGQNINTTNPWQMDVGNNQQTDITWLL